MHVFISHSHTEDAFVDKLVRSLDHHHIDSFVDHQDIQPGEHWPTRVQQALKTCGKMIAVISDNSVTSRNCMDEWDYFLDWKGDHRKEIIPVRLSDVEPYYRLTSFHYIDFRQGYDDPLNQLITRLVDKKVESAPIAPKRIEVDEALHAGLGAHYPLRRRPDKAIGIATGNIAEIVGVDVLVNSENDQLILDVATKDPRRATRSISAAIHSYGARWDDRGSLVEDIIKNELAAAVDARGLSVPVPLATVIDTSGGGLGHLGVRRIIHAVTVSGTRRRGSVPGPGTLVQLGRCVANALARIDALNNDTFAREPLKSVIFPVFTTGKERRQFADIAPTLILRAIDYLEYEATAVDTVYFVAYRQKDLDSLVSLLASFPDLDAPISGLSPSHG